MKLAELMSALSHALDITEGQPEGHCVRCCWIGMHLGRAIGLSHQALGALYYTLLLKDLGCSSNAARICDLYLTDDLIFKREFKLLDGSLPRVSEFVLKYTGLNASEEARFRALLAVSDRSEIHAKELVETRCLRGADIARQLRFSEEVSEGIRALDEHWDGEGKPYGLRGVAIPTLSRIALLSQVVDVFHRTGGPAAALTEAESRAGTWFDPELVRALRNLEGDEAFWETLASDRIHDAVFSLEPAHTSVFVTEDYLDEIATAFGQVIDSKSPYTAGHSARVARYAEDIGALVGLTEARRRWLRRGALLHDLGKLGVSNAILDKPGKLDAEEWEAVKRHATYTESILSRIGVFAELARVAGAHHERMDGLGYPRGLTGAAIPLEVRIITTADIFDAITARRPYRDAIPVARALDMMRAQLHTQIDETCFEALVETVRRDGLA
jgi:HD-GYP domain-containing protein (c-di-GMP phosphodiesterase class II)